MKIVTQILCALVLAAPAFAVDRFVTIERPVEVVRSRNEVSYWIKDDSQVRRKVVLSEPERVRIATVLEKEPSAVIRFNGTVSDTDNAFTVKQWNRSVTTTTTTNGDGSTTTERVTTETR